MLGFNNDRTYSPISPLKKPTVGRRNFLRQITQATILSGVIIILFMFGRDLLWSSSTNSYTIDPRDMDIVQSLCNPSSSSEQEQQVPSYLIEPTANFRPDTVIPSYTWETLPSKSVLYMVVRNEDIQEARSAMRSVEDRFNRHFKYPWVLLNDQDFTPTFQKYILKVTDAPIYFGKIDSNAWNYPSWIDIRSAEDHMDIMYALNIHRGGSLSFRQLLRYQSGLFIHHPLFNDVEYLWRVEPGSDITCEMMDYDPFVYMKEHNKTLGFTLTMREDPGSIENLWGDTRYFMDQHPEHILPYNETIMSWITDTKKVEYNMCHFWSNFEIIQLDFLRSKAYQDYFEFLDRKGGFFYERWGDNPVRTMAAAMFLPLDKIEFFNRIGYSHSVASHCPINKEDNIRCSCDLFENHDFDESSCTSDLLRLLNNPSYNELISLSKNQITSESTGSNSNEPINGHGEDGSTIHEEHNDSTKSTSLFTGAPLNDLVKEKEKQERENSNNDDDAMM